MNTLQTISLKKLKKSLEGELFTDNLHQSMYATDASIYRTLPLAVAFPKNKTDLKKLIAFATEHKVGLIPRAAGTSLAGQCVGKGIVVDISKYFTKITSLNAQKKTITVEPGVIRDELNRYLKTYGLFFSPNTSTSSRCTIGGMAGNNSSGTTSIQYGVTRDKILEIDAILSDGTEAVFQNLSSSEFKKKAIKTSLEGRIYKYLLKVLSKTINQKEIEKEFPQKSIHRRNTGYAIDALLESALFGGENTSTNLSKLLCGSEGTLAFTTQITLKLDNLPPAHTVMVAAHFNSIHESMLAVQVAMKHNLYACELMDKIILDCTKNNRQQQQNRFFLEKNPEAILMLEVSDHTLKEALLQAEKLIAELQQQQLGYAFPIITEEKVAQVRELRSAGLGALGNMIGDKKTVACIEDTAVSLNDLPNYIADFAKIMKKHKQQAVYYAHAGAGEIHLRPILNLKKNKDIQLFKTITSEVATLVKSYKGSLSGEHGDGIIRANFIPEMIGKKNYKLLTEIKKTFDPNNIFNPGKIVNPQPIDQQLRYKADRIEPEIDTVIDFSDTQGILRATEQCNGSGDCRKPVHANGFMCPSYHATKNEKDTTRARANVLREFLTNSSKKNHFNHEELKEVFDLCISCKACSSECPSNVDAALLKAEFLYQYQKTNGIPLRSKLFAYSHTLNKIGSLTPSITNALLNKIFTKKIIGIAPQRTIPQLYSITLKKWISFNYKKTNTTNTPKGKLYFFCDTYTNYYDVHIGIDAIKLLKYLNYEVIFINHFESGRNHISKGLLKKAQSLANKNVALFKDIVSKEVPLVGIEPSAILTFRDEYPKLCENTDAAKKLANHTFTIEEFLAREIEKGNIQSNQFKPEEKIIKIHGHCHQKSLSSLIHTFKILNLPKNYHVTIMNTGCCGMAGSFGYEKEHYHLSMQIGETTLFPKIRNTEKSTVIAASGTSCRHQILDACNRKAVHPVTILRRVINS